MTDAAFAPEFFRYGVFSPEGLLCSEISESEAHAWWSASSISRISANNLRSRGYTLHRAVCRFDGAPVKGNA